MILENKQRGVDNVAGKINRLSQSAATLLVPDGGKRRWLQMPQDCDVILLFPSLSQTYLLLAQVEGQAWRGQSG